MKHFGQEIKIFSFLSIQNVRCTCEHVVPLTIEGYSTIKKYFMNFGVFIAQFLHYRFLHYATFCGLFKLQKISVNINNYYYHKIRKIDSFYSEHSRGRPKKFSVQQEIGNALLLLICTVTDPVVCQIESVLRGLFYSSFLFTFRSKQT